MFNIAKFVNKGSKILAGTATLLTIHSYIQNPDKAQFTAYNEAVKERDRLIKELHQYQINSVQTDLQKVKIEALKCQLEQEHSSILKEVERLNQINPDKLGAKTDFKYHLEQFVTEAEKSNKTIGELIETINKNNFFPSLGDPKGLIENWYEFLSHLSTAQLGALTHIFSSIFILSCLVTIILIVYGDFLLDYLKLEVKYPKLARLIKLRRAFKHFYLFINFMLIIITLLALIYVNYTILF
uniref:hypothetical protein n=1 Tax=Pallidohirschioporus biformis TaxID=50381 RepID=UPI002E79BF74|nr:hypothetical protein V2724_mgp08 [Pallidohirschioporus biformis]WQA11124.1 hypothetical protein [Pallidohirschioporus biformis]